MSKEKYKNLIEKYKAGTTTLLEEAFLYNNAENSDPAFEAWSKFVIANKRKAPSNIKDSVWQAIQNKEIRKRRLTIRIMSAAASVLLLISIYFFNQVNGKLSYKEKETLLNEALTMLPDTEGMQVGKNIIYEDELIIIYTSVE